MIERPAADSGCGLRSNAAVMDDECWVMCCRRVSRSRFDGRLIDGCWMRNGRAILHLLCAVGMAQNSVCAAYGRNEVLLKA